MIPIFDNNTLGQYPRRYDQVSEEKDHDADKMVIADLLQWLQVDTADSSQRGMLSKAGITLSDPDKVKAISELQHSLHHRHKRSVKEFLHDMYYQVFKDQKQFKLSKKLTDKIKSEYGISNRVTQMMNDYLYNREQAVKSPLCKRYYKYLRRNGIHKADGMALEKTANFFAHELSLIQLEIDADNTTSAFQEDKRAVLFILADLSKAEGLPLSTRKHLEQAIAEH
jgi:hypothetical protein